MNQWKYLLYNLVLFLFYKLSRQIELDNKSVFNLLNSNYYNYTIEPRKVQIKYVNISNQALFTFKNLSVSKDLFVNFYSINCDIDITEYSNTKATIKKIQNDTVSVQIQSKLISTTQLLVKPSINVLDDINYKHINYRNCPVVINSMFIGENKLTDEDKETMALYFNSNIKSLTYEVNVKKNSFICFSFMFDKTTFFNVSTSDGTKRVITNTTKLFLDSDYLTKKNLTNITVNIILGTNEEVLLFLKVIESNSVSILQNNYLNQGFITSNTQNQYYFMEIFNEEEGEVMLHNKRQNGVLYGIIKQKNIDPYNISEYSIENSLEFDKHCQKLSFKSDQTKTCEKGCYLLIICEHQNSSNHNPIVGFEFTLLARKWDEEDYTNNPIINIPFNEYIFGAFEKESINHHYYSLFVPNGTDKIIIQIEGNYIEGFIGEGKRKLNTYKNSTEKLVMINNKNLVKIINKTELARLKYFNNYISFSFRSKNFFSNTFSFYYFRVIQIKEKEPLIYPLDSNVGNICLPELDPNSKKYYCSFSLRNDYNEFSLGYSISYPNQNENYNITAYKKDKNNGKIIVNSTTNFFEDRKNSYSLIIFKVEFNDNDNKNILSTFIDAEDDINSLIYMNQLFFITKTSKFVEFKLKHTFSFILKWIHGAGDVQLDEDGNFPLLSANSNYKGKPFCFPLSDIEEINITTTDHFIFITKLDYIMRNNEMREIFLGETLYEIFINKDLPIYYYMKYEKGKEIDVNFKILNKDDGKNTITNFYIKGYLLNENNIKRKINGDSLDLKDSIEGQYDPSYGFGILKIKNEDTPIRDKTLNSGGYLLIEINSKNNFINSNISIEILGILKNTNNTIVPINQHIQGYIEPNKIKKYLLRIVNKKTDLLLEFSRNSKDIKVKIDYDKCLLEQDYQTGVLKYRLTDLNNFSNDSILLSVSSDNKENFGNYNFRYFGTTKSMENAFIFSESSKIINEKLFIENSSLSISFDNIKILVNNTPLKNDSKVYFQIFGHLFEESNIIANEILNTTSLISSNIYYKNKTIATFSKDKDFNLYFANIKKVTIYYLQLNVHVIIGEKLNDEDFLSYIIKIDLSDYIDKEQKNQNKNIILVISIISGLLLTIIIIIIVFSCVYTKLKDKNKSLEDRVNSVEMLNAEKDKEIYL